VSNRVVYSRVNNGAASALGCGPEHYSRVNNGPPDPEPQLKNTYEAPDRRGFGVYGDSKTQQGGRL
jgi:hypothetical protein